MQLLTIVSLVFIFKVSVYITILLCECLASNCVFFIIKAKFMHDSIHEVRRNPFVTVRFQFAIFWTEMEHAALSFALFFATFKILH